MQSHNTGLRLPRWRRLNTAAQFQWVFAEPMRMADEYFAVLARRRIQDGKGARLGLAISRKYTPNAVRRNLIKRLVRESFRCQVSHYQWECHDIDCVVINRRIAAAASNARLRHSLEQHWHTLERHLCDNSYTI